MLPPEEPPQTRHTADVAAILVPVLTFNSLQLQSGQETGVDDRDVAAASSELMPHSFLAQVVSAQSPLPNQAPNASQVEPGNAPEGQPGVQTNAAEQEEPFRAEATFPFHKPPIAPSCDRPAQADKRTEKVHYESSEVAPRGCPSDQITLPKLDHGQTEAGSAAHPEELKGNPPGSFILSTGGTFSTQSAVASAHDPGQATLPRSEQSEQLPTETVLPAASTRGEEAAGGLPQPHNDHPESRGRARLDTAVEALAAPDRSPADDLSHPNPAIAEAEKASQPEAKMRLADSRPEGTFDLVGKKEEKGVATGYSPATPQTVTNPPIDTQRAAPELVAPPSRGDAEPIAHPPAPSQPAERILTMQEPPHPATWQQDTAQSGQTVSAAWLRDKLDTAEMHVHLRSPVLGGVAVHASVREANVGAEIRVDNYQTQAILASELPALERALAARDLRLETVTIRHESLTGGAPGGENSESFTAPFSYYQATQPPLSVRARLEPTADLAGELIEFEYLPRRLSVHA